MPTRSKLMSRARARICCSSPKAFEVARLSCLLLVDAEDFISLLLHAHCRSVDAIRDGLVEVLTLAQKYLDARESVGLASQQRTVFRILSALMGHRGVHPATNDDPRVIEITKVVRIEHDAATGGDDVVL